MTNNLQEEKHVFNVLYNNQFERIAFFPGSSRDRLLHTIRQAFDLPQKQKIRLLNEKREPFRLQKRFPTTIHVIPHGTFLNLGRSSSDKQANKFSHTKSTQSILQEPTKLPLYVLAQTLLPTQKNEKALEQASFLLERYGHFIQLSLPNMPATYLTDDPVVVQEFKGRQHDFTPMQQSAANSNLLGKLQQKAVHNTFKSPHDGLAWCNAAPPTLLSALHARSLQQDFSAILSATYELLAHLQAFHEQPWDACDMMQRTAWDAALIICCAQQRYTPGMSVCPSYFACSPTIAIRFYGQVLSC